MATEKYEREQDLHRARIAEATDALSTNPVRTRLLA